MSKPDVILSSGSIIWLGIKQAIDYTKDTGFDGIEILPTRRFVKKIDNSIKLYGKDKWFKSFPEINFIKSIHQNWRLDIGLDKKYKINFTWSLFFIILRLLFFPHPNKSKKIIGIISNHLQIPVIVHDISEKWTHDGVEFSGGVFYEIIGVKTRTPKEIKEWLQSGKHKIVVDTRDDQSLSWAKENNFSDWKVFWEWLGLKNIGGVQVTLIGRDGLSKILSGQQSIIEQQLLWLHKQKWSGVISVEVNPLVLLILTKGKMKQGFKIIADFIKQTAVYGKTWSNQNSFD